MIAPDDVLSFWFGEGPTPEARFALWFGRSAEADDEVKRRFGDALEAAARGHLDGWASSPRGRLALVVLLDQFSRQIFRGTPRMFEQDPRALSLVKEALTHGADRGYAVLEAGFFYLPLEHSELLEDQLRSVACYEALHARAPESLQGATAEFLRYARLHLEIIKRFGHFPHRNAVLGRPSTPEELAFLQEPDSSF